MPVKLIDPPKRRAFEIRNASSTKAEIILYGAIGDSFFEDGVSAKDFSDALAGLSPSVKNVDLRISSPGGDVFQGYTIASRIKQHPAKFTAYIDGLAASIATLIALAADKVVMAEEAQFMIHNSWTFTMGNVRDLEKTIDRLSSIDEQLVSTYSRKTKMDRLEVKAYMDEETWFTSQQALDLGFVDEVVADELQIAASVLDKAKWLDQARVAELKKSGDKEARAKIKELKNKVESFLARKKA